MYNMHHFSSLQSNSNNHRHWQDYNQPYYDKKWFSHDKERNYAFPFGQCDSPDGSTPPYEDWIKLDINRSEPHSDKWLPLGYPPYPIEYEVNRFWKQLTKDEE